MKRTCQRPLVQGMNPKLALTNGLFLASLGLSGLYWYNPLTAAVGASIWGIY